MCTCLKLNTSDYYFGRNLDLEYRFNERVVITPRNYLFNLKNKEKFHTKYAIIGMATKEKLSIFELPERQNINYLN